jgi:hypothetical protein
MYNPVVTYCHFGMMYRLSVGMHHVPSSTRVFAIFAKEKIILHIVV